MSSSGCVVSLLAEMVIVRADLKLWHVQDLHPQVLQAYCKTYSGEV